MLTRDNVHKYSDLGAGAATKAWLTACCRTLIVGLNATSITSASIEINERFNVSDTQFPNSYWPVTSWGIGAALAPMVILPIMEANGMRPGYLVS